MDWRLRAACRDAEPDLFLPAGAGAQIRLAEAKSVCRVCPVLIQCRTWALATGQDTGVWGGMSADERRALRRHDRVEPLLPRGLRVAAEPIGVGG